MVPVLAFAGVGATLAYRQQQQAVREAAVDDAQRLSEAVDRELADSVDAAEGLAALPALDSTLDTAAFTEIARRELSRHPEWVTVLLLDPTGRRLVNASTPDRLGPAVDAASIAPLVQRRSAIIGNIAQGPRRFGIPIRAPVIRDDQVRAIVTVVIAPDGISRQLRAAAAPEGWLTTVVDGSGRVVARSHGQASYLGRPASAAALAARARAWNGVYEGYTLERIATVSAFWKSPASNWSVHVGIPREVYEAPLRRSLTMVVGGAALALLLTGAFVALLVRELRMRRVEAAAMEQTTRMEALGRLTGGVAHDFNNLLMIIQGNAEILQRRARDEAVSRPLAAIRAATERASKLTRELLIFARGGPADRAVIDLNATVEGFLEAVRQAVGPGVAVNASFDPAAGSVEVDRVQLELALLNLAVNARDAMGDQGRITLSTRRIGDAALLAVHDTGPGIPREIAARIFDPFFTTKPAGVGTGLGLTQVYGFARHAGGSVTARNGESGAIVEIRLPASKRSVETIAPAAPTSTVDLAGRRVLVLDDDAAVRGVAAAHLRDLGAQVEEAGSADEGLARLEAGEFDALVSDIVMPGALNGLTLAEAVRARWPRLRILLMSGYSDSSVEAAAKGFRVLSKPYPLDELDAALRDLLRPEAA